MPTRSWSRLSRLGSATRPQQTPLWQDVASRMANRVQISTDGLRAYVDAVEKAFGADVDYGQIVKTYGHEEASDNRRYSATRVCVLRKEGHRR